MFYPFPNMVVGNGSGHVRTKIKPRHKGQVAISVIREERLCLWWWPYQGYEYLPQGGRVFLLSGITESKERHVV